MSEKTSPSPTSEQTINLPSPSPGTERQITALRYGQPGARPKVYMQTALHADEYPGMLVLHHLRKQLDQAASNGAITGEIVLVPVANPIGMTQRIAGVVSGRLDLNNGKNYNRHYPDLMPHLIELLENKLSYDQDENDQIIRKALVEAVNSLPDSNESDAYRKILLQLSADSDYCMDLHCDNEAILYLYSSGTHPLIADQLCAIMGCEVHLVDSTNSNCFDGTISLAWKSLAVHFPDFPIDPGCMGCTIEYRGQSDVTDEYAQGDAQSLMQFLINQGAVAGNHSHPGAPLCKATPLEAQIYLYSPKAGIVVYKKEVGEWVAKGEAVAEIVDPLATPTEARSSVYALIDGKIMSRTRERLLGPGQILMAIVGDKIVPERVGSYLLSD